MNRWWCTIGFYLTSMFFFLVIVIILGTSIPVYCGPDWEFAGWDVFLQKGVIIPIVCLSLIAVSIIFGLWISKRKEGSRLGPITGATFENVSGDVMSFVAAYFFPLVSFNLNSTWRHVVVLALLFVILGAVFVCSDLYYCNPTLILLGYRTYKATWKTKDGKEVCRVIIIRDTMNEGDRFKYIPIDNKTYFAYKIKDDKGRTN